MSKPILANIPSGYNTNRLYSILPFDGSGDFAFSRGSSATRVNKDGIIETVSNNIPRLDYADGSCPSLLLEPQRTNTFLNSEPTSNESVAGEITYESYFWENGLQNSILFGDNSVTRFRYGGTGTLNQPNTLSFYIKMDDLGEPFPALSNTGSDKDFSFAIGGDILSASFGYFSKKYVGNNIWKIQATRNSTASWTNSAFNGIAKFTGHSNRGFKVTGLQLEAGSYPTSYIPTTGFEVTRSADNCYGAGDVNLFNDSEGVLYAELQTLADEPLNRYVSMSDGISSPYTNSISIQYRSDGNIRVYFGGLATSNLLCVMSSVDATDINKIAVRFKDGDMAVYLNGINQSLFGGFVYTNVTGLNQLSFHQPGINTNLFYGKCKDIRVYNQALTDTELATLTTL